MKTMKHLNYQMMKKIIVNVNGIKYKIYKQIY